VATAKQELGALGERLVVQHCACPRCKRGRTLKTLPANFKCADVICDFCGYLAQVKASTSADGETPPRLLLGAAWGPQQARMEAGIYFPLFLVLVAPRLGIYSIHFLPADLQPPELFLPRAPLSETARRAGWQGFYYDLGSVRDRLVRLAGARLPKRRTNAAQEPPEGLDTPS
jgi:Dam-replacing family